jgi:Cellulase (glycosyl hydrolase family 5)
MNHAFAVVTAVAVSAFSVASCGSSSGNGGASETDGGSRDGTTPGDGSALPTGGDSGVSDSGTGSHDDSGVTDAGHGGDSGSNAMDSGADTGTFDGGAPAGWLYTNGPHIYVSNGSTGTAWMGRGVNVDDLYFCGKNEGLQQIPSPATVLESIGSGLVSGWNANFFRVSLTMDTYTPYSSWLDDASQYSMPMTAVINALGANPGVYVLVTLRSDVSMIDGADGDCTPSDSASTPNTTLYPTGTDAVYVALVDTFAHSSFVLFGLSNEPGGDSLTDATISAAMSHAVGVIRAEEDHLGVPHHLVSVQGNDWTSKIGFYSTTPLPYDNVVYEVHGYPPPATSYTYPNIPVIIGEYGGSGEAAGADISFTTAFYTDIESKQIPNLAWDADPYNDCSPDLLMVSSSDTNLAPTPWGSAVKNYLMAH